MNFDFDEKQRKEILNKVLNKVEHFYANTKDYSTTPSLDLKEIRNIVESENLVSGTEPNKAIEHILKGLEKYSVHTPHPKYFGLFNPRANFAGIIADFITASYNPQLAAWSHAPFAVEVEAHIIKQFIEKFGLNPKKSDGVFTTGGAEANLTAVLSALNNKYPDFAKNGMFGLDKKPIIFCSQETHHSVQKAAKIVGLGYEFVKTIPTTKDLKIDTDLLEKEIKNLNNSTHSPLMVIGTAGTTGTGTIDDLEEISKICKTHNIWFHVDAAYGGGAVLSSNLKHILKGISASDSITFDAHKWMSVPMGTSVFLTSHKEILNKTFRITTEYMPKEANELEIVEPFSHSVQWSRRFIGLKVYLSLLFYGWNGYEKVINHQAKMREYLRAKLTENNWMIKNSTELPVVCFTGQQFESDVNFTKSILDNILARGNSWISVYPIKNVPTFRACITNYNTTEIEIDELIEELNKEREAYQD